MTWIQLHGLKGRFNQAPEHYRFDSYSSHRSSNSAGNRCDHSFNDSSNPSSHNRANRPSSP